jgi:glucan phosphoethanolaminetransferase (alkaline phosphatase superfamily)
MKELGSKIINKITRGLRGRDLATAILKVLGRNGMFFGLAGIVLSFIVFGADMYGLPVVVEGPPATEPIITGFWAGVVSFLAVVAALFLLAYMLLAISRMVRVAINFLSKHTNTPVNLKLELSLTLMIYALAVVLMASTFTDEVLAITVFFVFAMLATMGCFVLADSLQPKNTPKKTKKPAAQSAADKARAEAEEAIKAHSNPAKSDK